MSVDMAESNGSGYSPFSNCFLPFAGRHKSHSNTLRDRNEELYELNIYSRRVGSYGTVSGSSPYLETIEDQWHRKFKVFVVFFSIFCSIVNCH